MNLYGMLQYWYSSWGGVGVDSVLGCEKYNGGSLVILRGKI